jgi:hypothetical protein
MKFIPITMRQNGTKTNCLYFGFTLLKIHLLKAECYEIHYYTLISKYAFLNEETTDAVFQQISAANHIPEKTK